MVDTSLACLAKDDEAHVWKVKMADMNTSGHF
jgi:hypothetical protein